MTIFGKDEWMTPTDASVHLNVTKTTVLGWLKKGTLKGTKLGGRYYVHVPSLPTPEIR
jgi:excisionase family DNA binding protein